MEKGKQIEAVHINAMTEAIVSTMPKLTVRERRLMYRFAYTQIVCNKHRGEADFEKEPWPPVPQLTSRVKVLLRDADGDDVRRVFKLLRTFVDRRKKKE